MCRWRRWNERLCHVVILLLNRFPQMFSFAFLSSDGEGQKCWWPRRRKYNSQKHPPLPIIFSINLLKVPLVTHIIRIPIFLSFLFRSRFIHPISMKLDRGLSGEDQVQVKASQAPHRNANGQTDHESQRQGHSFVTKWCVGVNAGPNPSFSIFCQLISIMRASWIHKRSVTDQCRVHHGTEYVYQKVDKVSIVEVPNWKFGS